MLLIAFQLKEEQDGKVERLTKVEAAVFPLENKLIALLKSCIARYFGYLKLDEIARLKRRLSDGKHRRNPRGRW
jgi:hypothetical protein